MDGTIPFLSMVRADISGTDEKLTTTIASYLGWPWEPFQGRNTEAGFGQRRVSCWISSNTESSTDLSYLNISLFASTSTGSLFVCLPTPHTFCNPWTLSFLMPSSWLGNGTAFVFLNHLEISFRILKDEYERTRYQVILKARFPSLLSKLWATDAIKVKNNMVKSFMKAGVFPFNPNSIDRSRILQSSASSTTTPFDLPSRATSTDQASETTRASDSAPIVADRDKVPGDRSTVHAVSSFASSREAISSLNDVLEQTKAFEDDGDSDTDDDRSLFGKRRELPSSISPAANQKHPSRSANSSAADKSEAARSRSNAKRKRTIARLVGFDTSDEDGNVQDLSRALSSISIFLL
jgi:hypothetical protein